MNYKIVSCSGCGEPTRKYWGTHKVFVFCSVQCCNEHYKSLARLHHPDVGGDTETMAKINTAFQEAMNMAHK